MSFGVLTGQKPTLDAKVRDQLISGLKVVDGDINKAGLRMISLKGLEAQIGTE